MDYRAIRENALFAITEMAWKYEAAYTDGELSPIRSTDEFTIGEISISPGFRPAEIIWQVKFSFPGGEGIATSNCGLDWKVYITKFHETLRKKNYLQSKERTLTREFVNSLRVFLDSLYGEQVWIDFSPITGIWSCYFNRTGHDPAYDSPNWETLAEGKISTSALLSAWKWGDVSLILREVNQSL